MIMSKTEVKIINVNVNNFQAAYTNLGLGPIPAGTTLDSVVKDIKVKLTDNLEKSWPKKYEPYTAEQVDGAIMTPWKDNIPGTAPQCVLDAISLDFEAWGLPVDTKTITLMAKEITQQISNKGGEYGTFYGKSHIAAAETIQWGLSFVTAIVVDKPEQIGIIYSFSAVLSLS
jgi:hypothetical protein